MAKQPDITQLPQPYRGPMRDQILDNYRSARGELARDLLVGDSALQASPEGSAMNTGQRAVRWALEHLLRHMYVSRSVTDTMDCKAESLKKKKTSAAAAEADDGGAAGAPLASEQRGRQLVDYSSPPSSAGGRIPIPASPREQELVPTLGHLETLRASGLEARIKLAGIKSLNGRTLQRLLEPFGDAVRFEVQAQALSKWPNVMAQGPYQQGFEDGTRILTLVLTLRLGKWLDAVLVTGGEAGHHGGAAVRVHQQLPPPPTAHLDKAMENLYMLDGHRKALLRKLHARLTSFLVYGTVRGLRVVPECSRARTPGLRIENVMQMPQGVLESFWAAEEGEEPLVSPQTTTIQAPPVAPTVDGRSGFTLRLWVRADLARTHKKTAGAGPGKKRARPTPPMTAEEAAADAEHASPAAAKRPRNGETRVTFAVDGQ